MGTLVEKFHDAKGIMWPTAVAPFQVHLIELQTSKTQKFQASQVYQNLQKAGVEVFWDDTDRSAGAKFADADLIGIPVRLVVSDKTGDKVEWKKRDSQEAEVISVEEAIHRVLR